jgi:sugar fermentation stimulation protein A
MRYPAPLIPGKLIKRYKRFLADIVLDDGTEITAHCANTGTMLGVNQPGSEVWVSPANNPKRKLQYTWELVRAGDGLVGINTALANRIAEEAINEGAIPELKGYGEIRREVKYGKNSRIDLLLSGPGDRKCYVEVKSVTLKRGAMAEFPDAVTARGTKHLAELADQVRAGQRAVMLYVMQRGDADRFTIAADIDPAYSRALIDARRAGVEALCYRSRVGPAEIAIESPVAMAITDAPEN